MNIVIYTRYSDENQREESIEGQIRECREYAERRNFTVVNVYIDRAISGKTDDRPEFQRMIRESARKQFEIVLVWKLDRFARNRYDSAHYKAILKKNGVRVASAKENISEGAEGIILEAMLEGMAEYYSVELAEKVNRGMTENVLNGKNNGGAPTFGYVSNKTQFFEIDPEAAPIVTDIFNRFASGETTKNILQNLRESGFTTKKGKPPTYSFITNLLKNRRYLGEYRFKETVVENAFTPLVTPEIFEKCQARLKENQRKPAHFKPVEDKYILTGKIFCGYCGATVLGVSGKSKTGKKHRYYHCRAAKLGKPCEKKRVTKDFVESTVVDYTLKLLSDNPLISGIVNTIFDLQKNHNAHLPALENRLAQAEKEIENVMTAIKMGIITNSTKTTLENLEREKESLEIAIALEKIERPTLEKEQIRYWICKFRETDPADEAQKRKLVDVFVNGVHIYNDKMLILFNYKDGEKCVTFEDVEKALSERTNLDNHEDYRGSPLESFAHMV
jgi:DNA invertase Pin-like site-specific DNA recombinase